MVFGYFPKNGESSGKEVRNMKVVAPLDVKGLYGGLSILRCQIPCVV